MEELQNVENNEEELEVDSEEVGTEEDGDSVQEDGQNALQGDGEDEYLAEEMEESPDVQIINYDNQLNTIIEELIYQREVLDTMQEYIEYRDMNIFEKPLGKYTVMESLMVLTFFIIVFGVVLKMIGGIITCKV